MDMDKRWWDPEIGKQRKEEFLRFAQDMIKETDRGCIISAVSYLELLIERISRERLGNNNAAKELLGLGRPLEGFVNRCQLCFCLNLISEDEFFALQQAARIRNRFAHRLFAEIEGEPFRNQLKELKKHLSKVVDLHEFQEIKKNDYRSHFTNCISILASRLLHRDLIVAEVKKQETTDVPNWHHELLKMTDEEKSKNDH